MRKSIGTKSRARPQKARQPFAAKNQPELLEKELATFEQKKSELLADSEGRFALIYERRLIGTYNDEMDAIAEGYKKLGNVPFLVKQVVAVDPPAEFVNHHVGF